MDELQQKWEEILACVEQLRQRTSEARRIVRLVLAEEGVDVNKEEGGRGSTIVP